MFGLEVAIWHPIAFLFYFILFFQSFCFLRMQHDHLWQRRTVLWYWQPAGDGLQRFVLLPRVQMWWENKIHSSWVPRVFCVVVFVISTLIISLCHACSSPECDPTACPPVSALSCREDQFLVEVRGEKPCCYSYLCGTYTTIQEIWHTHEKFFFFLFFFLTPSCRYISRHQIYEQCIQHYIATESKWSIKKWFICFWVSFIRCFDPLNDNQFKLLLQCKKCKKEVRLNFWPVLLVYQDSWSTVSVHLGWFNHYTGQK